MKIQVELWGNEDNLEDCGTAGVSAIVSFEGCRSEALEDGYAENLFRHIEALEAPEGWEQLTVETDGYEIRIHLTPWPEDEEEVSEEMSDRGLEKLKSILRIWKHKGCPSNTAIHFEHV